MTSVIKEGQANLIFPLVKSFWTKGHFVLQKTFRDAWRKFWLSHGWRESVAGIQWVEATDTALYPTRHETALPPAKVTGGEAVGLSVALQEGSARRWWRAWISEPDRADLNLTSATYLKLWFGYIDYFDVEFAKDFFTCTSLYVVLSSCYRVYFQKLPSMG